MTTNEQIREEVLKEIGWHPPYPSNIKDAISLALQKKDKELEELKKEHCKHCIDTVYELKKEQGLLKSREDCSKDEHWEETAERNFKKGYKEGYEKKDLETKKEIDRTYKSAYEQGKFDVEIETQHQLQKLKEKIWFHPRKFEGDKSKTCLALDYVDDLIDEIFGDKEQKEEK